MGVREDRLLHLAASLPARVDQAVKGDAFDRLLDPVVGVRTLVGKVVLPVGDNQAEIASTRPVHAGVVDLREGAPADREPDQTRRVRVRAEGRPDPVLG